MADVWYYRENKDDQLVGPLSFSRAEAGAMFYSTDDEKSGTAEVVSILGNRPGDPAGIKRRVVVERMYLRGKVVATGRLAQYLSDSGTPPTLGGAI